MALAKRAPLLALDEPVASLDPIARLEFMREAFSGADVVQVRPPLTVANTSVRCTGELSGAAAVTASQARSPYQ